MDMALKPRTEMLERRWDTPGRKRSPHRVRVVGGLGLLVVSAVTAGAVGASSATGILLLGVVAVLVAVVGRPAPGGIVDDHVLATVGLAEIERELARSRRFDRPLAVARLALGPAAKATDVALTIDQLGRRFDRYFFDGNSEVLLLMPETPDELAERVTDRLAAAVAEQTGEAITVGVASYPGPESTAAKLIAAAAPSRMIPPGAIRV